MHRQAHQQNQDHHASFKRCKSLNFAVADWGRRLGDELQRREVDYYFRLLKNVFLGDPTSLFTCNAYVDPDACCTVHDEA